jgi:hypothetical protein
MIFAVQITVTTGIIRRINVGNIDQSKKYALVIANLVLFLGTLLIFEIRHRNLLKSKVPFKTKEDI